MPEGVAREADADAVGLGLDQRPVLSVRVANARAVAVLDAYELARIVVRERATAGRLAVVGFAQDRDDAPYGVALVERGVAIPAEFGRDLAEHVELVAVLQTALVDHADELALGVPAVADRGSVARDPRVRARGDLAHLAVRECDVANAVAGA